MSRLTDAITWSGSGATLSLFAVFEGQRIAAIVTPEDVETGRVDHYRLDDIDRRLPGRQCHEYDLTFDAIPADLKAVVLAWLSAAMEAGAQVAWFAFEGSFDFNHILSADVSDQIFAVASGRGVACAIDDDLRATAYWSEQVVAIRELVGLK